MKARILIADDHWAIRQALTEVISKCGNAEVAAEAVNGIEAIALAEETRPDLIILDISLPKLRGMQVLRQLRATGFSTPILIFSMYPADQYADISRRWGAQGFLSKDAEEPEIAAAIKSVLSGALVFPKSTRRRIVNIESSLNKGTVDLLSKREVEVFRSLTRGETNKSIASRLKISPKSVTTYRDRIFAKLEVHSVAELCNVAAREGLLETTPA